MEKMERISLNDWLSFLEGGLDKSTKIKSLYDSGEFKVSVEIPEAAEWMKEASYENAYCA